MQGIGALMALNFFMADMQAGIGPFLGVFLLAHHWDNAAIGTIMTLGGLAGMVMTVPAGALVDYTRRKRLLVAISGVCTIGGSAMLLISQNIWIVSSSQVLTAIAGAAIGPAVAGMTLGMVRQSGFDQQNGRNQAYNHAGNLVGAGLSGLLGWQFGFGAIMGLAVLFGLASIVSVFRIPANAIDHRAARGERAEGAGTGTISGWRVLVECKPLLVLAASLLFFHLGNGAMLPLYGMAIASAHQGNPSALVASTIVVAQAVMIVMSLVAMRMARRRALWLAMLISFLALPIRGVLAAHFIVSWGVFPVQILDGVGAGLQSVAVPAFVAHILNGTGRVNAGQGAVMTVQGVGASLSPALGGAIAGWLGYSSAFLILGCMALVSIAIWIAGGQMVRCASGSVSP
jgi:MFS family permease